MLSTTLKRPFPKKIKKKSVDEIPTKLKEKAEKPEANYVYFENKKVKETIVKKTSPYNN